MQLRESGVLNAIFWCNMKIIRIKQEQFNQGEILSELNISAKI
jgi:hypothetical protein